MTWDDALSGLDAARRAGWAKYYAEKERADEMTMLLSITVEMWHATMALANTAMSDPVAYSKALDNYASKYNTNRQPIAQLATLIKQGAI